MKAAVPVRSVRHFLNREQNTTRGRVESYSKNSSPKRHNPSEVCSSTLLKEQEPSGFPSASPRAKGNNFRARLRLISAGVLCTENSTPKQNLWDPDAIIRESSDRSRWGNDHSIPIETLKSSLGRKIRGSISRFSSPLSDLQPSSRDLRGGGAQIAP